MDSERLLPGQTVLVQHGRITALGPTGDVPVPPSAVRIDGRGKFLIPGLSDCHAHVGSTSPFGLTSGDSSLSPTRVAEARLLQWLADGVTAIRNLDYMDQGKYWRLSGADALRLRARAAAGELWSPRISTAGQWGPGHYTNFAATFGGQKGLPAPHLDSVAVYVAAYQAAGYDFLKIHEETPAVFAAVLAAARQVGIPVVGHVPNGELERALAGGMRSIEHLTGYPSGKSVSDSQVQTLAAATRDAGTWNCVTMQLGAVDPGYAKLVQALHEAGAGLLLGSDFPLGAGVQRELEVLVQQAGLTPYEALATGTRNFAQASQTLDESGTIAVGKRADLVLLDGNPLQDITNVKRRAGVMLGGRWLTRDALEQRLLAFPRYGVALELRRAGLVTFGPGSEQLAQFDRWSDSLAAAKPHSPEYERGVRQQAGVLGTLRASLTPAQHGAFDAAVRGWLGAQARQGYRVAIAGVPPSP